MAIRSREGKHFRHAGSAVAESRPIFIAAVVLLGSSITRTAATGHTSLFALSAVNRAVTSNATLPPAGADIGPSLASAGVTTPLANPTLSLRDANGNVIASNDNWKDSQQAAIAATGKALSNDNESAILGLLAPGNYTAIVAGKNGTTGVALIEFYSLP